uniref:MutL C-terminal dimerisation domain-containing protein n=1 Tax=Kwoniella bestiolae CBS 10118 TaxID=1296100 RepID=A0A1B9G184_9TREE|nr:hypothetical protein I302_06244 [Kwoniella bestiolae CBS 10118]OCF24783.1 hypothetical protein I302_06244 [Kwoniella bestiolae CBS 10118]
MEPITPLPTPTSTALRSSFIIPTLPQILSELIQNSLDAGSRHLDISICLIKGSESIRVRDDGCGIGEQGLRKVGKRFRTSKTLNESNLGSVGSYGFRGEALSSIASLSLLSITSKTNLTLKAITKIMKSSKTLYLGNDPSRHIPSDSGTIVTVKEIFHNIPVRKEELQRSNEDTLMRQCKKFIEVFALARCGVNWLVWDERGMGDRRKVLDIRGTKSNVHVFRSLYGNALVKRVQNIRVSAGSNRVDGFISLSGDITKSHQHLYINNYPITRSDLHLAISKKFSDSRFGTFASAGEHDDLEDLSADEFLKKNGYDRIKSNIKPLSPSSTKGAATNLVSPAAALHGKSPLGKESTSRQDVENGWDLSKPTSLSFSNLNPSATSTRSLDVENTNPDPQLSPLPTTTNNFPPRISEKPSQSHQWITDLENSIDSGALPFTRRTSPKKRRLEVMQSDETPSEDEGCTYHHHDQPIDPLSARPITLESPAKKRKIDIQLPKSSLKHAHVIGQVDKKFVAVTLPTSKSEDKAVVLVDQHAADERISVENILTSLCMGFRTGDMAITKLTKHTPTILLTTSESEQLARPGAMDVFRRWGIHLTLPFLGIIEGDYVQVQVEAVPSLLVNRLGKKEGVEMTRLIRGYLPVLSEEMGGIKALLDSYSRVKRVEGDWGKEIRFMPREMLELANSKACRGAIMFQDFLNTDQQSRLVSQLGQTKFPFMCAHGRPSMIPLVALQVPPAISTKKVWKREIDWKGWKAKSQSSSR